MIELSKHLEDVLSCCQRESSFILSLKVSQAINSELDTESMSCENVLKLRNDIVIDAENTKQFLSLFNA